MCIDTENGTFFTDSFEEIADIIKNSGEIWISAKQKYPCLALLVCEDKVCLNFFGESDTDIWLSESKCRTKAVFRVSGTDWEAPENSVISLDIALECVKQFMLTLKRPDRIGWQYGV